MATERTSPQLVLLETAPFAGGPARLPKARSAKHASGASLPLDFSPKRAPTPVDDARRAAIEKAHERLRAQVEQPAKASPKAAEPPPPAPDADDDPPEEYVFVWPRKTSAEERAQLLEAVGERLGCGSRRGVVLAADGRARLTARAETRTFHVACIGGGAARWLRDVRAVAREHGLAEVE